MASGLGYVYLSLYWLLFAWVLNIICRRTRLNLLVAAPPLWILTEYLRCNLSFLAIPWALLAQTQHQNIPVIQMASLAGICGVSFLVMMVNAAVADLVVHVFSPSPQPSPARGAGVKQNNLWGRDESREDGLSACWTPKGLQKLIAYSRRTLVRLVVALFIVGGVWIWGWASLHSNPSGKPLSVAVVQGNIPQKIKEWAIRPFIFRLTE